MAKQNYKLKSFESYSIFHWFNSGYLSFISKAPSDNWTLFFCIYFIIIIQSSLRWNKLDCISVSKRWQNQFVCFAIENVRFSRTETISESNEICVKKLLLDFRFNCYASGSAPNSHQIFFFLLFSFACCLFVRWSETNICGYALRLTNTENV